MTKAEWVQSLLHKLEDSNVKFPTRERVWSSKDYWEKHPAGYVLEEELDENLTSYPTIESRLACFSKISLNRLLASPVPEGIEFYDLWQTWGRNGLLSMPATSISLDGRIYLQLRYNLFISYRSTGFVAIKDLSGKQLICNPCNTMYKSRPYLALLTKMNVICMAIYWSYLMQALAPWEECPYLLRYNPALLGNFLIALERENPDDFPRPVKGKVPAYALPQFVSCLPVDEKKLVQTISLTDGRFEFGRLFLATDRVCLRLHQVDGTHDYSFNFPEWELQDGSWDWDGFNEYWDRDTDLTAEEYNRFMWYRLSCLLIGVAGVPYSPDLFLTRSCKKLKLAPMQEGVPLAFKIQDVEHIIDRT